MKTLELKDEQARMADEAEKEYDKHIAKLQRVLTEEHGFPAVDYKAVVELSGRPEGAVVHWDRTLRHTPAYLQATAKISDAAFKGLEILDKAHRPCTLPDDFYTRDSKSTYEAMRDALFDEEAALSHGGDFIFEPVMPVSSTTMHLFRCGDRYEVRDGYGRLTDAGKADGSLEEGIVDGYTEAIPKTVTPPLVDELRRKAATVFERPVIDEETSFDAWVCHGYSVLDAGLASGTVKDLSLLSKMGDESLSKDVRMKAFLELRDKYCGVSLSTWS